MKVYAYDPYVNKFDDWVEAVNDLNTITKNVDILAPCVHLNNETEGIIGKQEILNLKKGSYLINTSRGEVIDEDALISAIESGHLAGAAVDVISGEQTKNIREHKLVDLAKNNKNFYITPHRAGLTIESESKAQTAAFEAVTKYLESI
jgi:phosphoglycerate dehydrogenase-like enzyme